MPALWKKIAVVLMDVAAMVYDRLPTLDSVGSRTVFHNLIQVVDDSWYPFSEACVGHPSAGKLCQLFMNSYGKTQ